jgi:hypothetical protein
MYSGGVQGSAAHHFNPDSINQILKDFSDKHRQLESPDLIQTMHVEESFVENPRSTLTQKKDLVGSFGSPMRGMKYHTTGETSMNQTRSNFLNQN